MVEVVEAEADIGSGLGAGRDGGEQAAAEEGDGRTRETKDGAVEQDEGAEGGVGARGVLEGAQDGERGGPAGVVGVVVAGHEEHGVEAGELDGEEGQAGAFVDGDVADVAEEGERGGDGGDGVEVVGLGAFEVEVGEDLDRCHCMAGEVGCGLWMCGNCGDESCFVMLEVERGGGPENWSPRTRERSREWLPSRFANLRLFTFGLGRGSSGSGWRVDLEWEENLS